ncbi:MAG: type II toxin-antitoxin system Phd/YefM family antitoxin [Pseudomonadota bacterium]
MEIDSYIPVTKAKSKLLDVIRMIDDRDDTVAITRNGIPKAVLMSMEHYETLLETMAVLGDQDVMRQISNSRDEISEGKPLIDLADLI